MLTQNSKSGNLKIERTFRIRRNKRESDRLALGAEMSLFFFARTRRMRKHR